MNWMNISFGLLTAGSLVVPMASGSLKEWSQLRELKSQQSINRELAQVADQRYQSGCLLLSAGVYPKLKFPSVQIGMIPKNRETGQVLPSGTVVCDTQGGTGVVDSTGAIASVSVTQNRKLVQTAIKRFRGGTYSQPCWGVGYEAQVLVD